jgi:hypothetical protein
MEIRQPIGKYQPKRQNTISPGREVFTDTKKPPGFPVSAEVASSRHRKVSHACQGFGELA